MKEDFLRNLRKWRLETGHLLFSSLGSRLGIFNSDSDCGMFEEKRKGVC